MVTEERPIPPTRKDVEDTAGLLRGVVIRTPLVESAVLNERSGGRVLLKLETMQHMNSFKFRGAMSRLLRLDEQERQAGVVAWSSGNHAQAVAAAGRRLGVPATIVMPADAPSVKLSRTRALGARVVTYNRASESREEISYRLARENGFVVVPSFDDRWVIAGQGTAGVEILEQSGEFGVTPDDLLVCCGGGGLTAGCALALEGSGTNVWTVEPVGYDDHRRSFRSGEREKADTSVSSICDALLAPAPGELTFAVNASRVAGGYAVTDEEVREAMRFAFDELRLVIEPGGAAALAALLAGKHDGRDRTTVLMVSGGNVDPGFFAEVVTAPRRTRGGPSAA